MHRPLTVREYKSSETPPGSVVDEVPVIPLQNHWIFIINIAATVVTFLKYFLEMDLLKLVVASPGVYASINNLLLFVLGIANIILLVNNKSLVSTKR